MKIVFIGDPHGRDTWKKIIEKEKYFDLVIFAGDYVSSHEKITEEEQIENLKDILTYKEENPDKVILLRGNHDLQHIGYFWAECSGLFRKVLQYMSQEEVEERYLKDTQWIYIYKDIIFSHAGISKTWLKEAGCSIEEINNLRPSTLFGFTPDNAFDNYGTSTCQPLTWIRPQALMKDAIDDYIQVVGHTTVREIVDLYEYDKRHHIWICDTLPFQYLVIEDGEFIPTWVDKPTIVLPNRYNLSVWLENVEGNKWLLTGEKDALTYVGIGFLDQHIYSVDPEGGPYLAEGESVAGRKITSIVHDSLRRGYILTLEDEDKKD